MAHRAYLSLGSNLEPRVERIRQARDWLALRHELVGASRLYETEPLGPGTQGWHINQVIELRTEASPNVLLTDCLSAEQIIGRQPREKWGPREIDIDILLFDALVLDTVLATGPNAGQTLQIPHPELPNRRFILEPLAEIATEMVDPRSGRTIQELLDSCQDRLKITVYKM